MHLPKFFETEGSLLTLVESEPLVSFFVFLDSVETALTTAWPLFEAEFVFEPEILEFSDDLLEAWFTTLDFEISILLLLDEADLSAQYKRIYYVYETWRGICNYYCTANYTCHHVNLTIS